MFLFYSANRFEGERIGGCIYVDQMMDPFTTAGNPVLVVEPTMDEDIYWRDRYQKGQHWHTIEGAFYFREGDWQYVMYPGNCFENPPITSATPGPGPTKRIPPRLNSRNIPMIVPVSLC